MLLLLCIMLLLYEKKKKTFIRCQLHPKYIKYTIRAQFGCLCNMIIRLEVTFYANERVR